MRRCLPRRLIGPVLLLVSVAARPAQAQLDTPGKPIPVDELARFSDGMLGGEHLRYGLYGRQPIRWLEGATGDRMLSLAREGRFPEDGEFKHVSFIYGSYWDNCRRYYMAYRITGNPEFVEQLRQYARLMDWILEDRPWLVLPQGKREPHPTDPVATIPHEPAAASNFIGHALAARLTLQMAGEGDGTVTAPQLAKARRFAQTVVTYMESRVVGTGAMSADLDMPRASAEIVRKTPYNQSFMLYSVLAVTAAALQDLQRLDGNAAHQGTIELYQRIARAGIAKFIGHSDVTEIDGRSYLFHSHSPADRYEQIRDPDNRGRRIAHFIDGHPVMHYPEDIPHSQSQAWNLVLLWETDRTLGVTEEHLTGVANAHVDYVLRGKAPLRDGTVGPPNHILSPWTLEGRPEVKWSRHGKPALVYAIYLPFRGDIAQATREMSNRGKKEMNSPKGKQFILFAHYLEAQRNQPGILHLSH